MGGGTDGVGWGGGAWLGQGGGVSFGVVRDGGE
jgi:hypothetical protein